MEPVGDNRLKIINHTDYPFTIGYYTDTVPEYPSVNHTQVYIRDSINVSDTIEVVEHSRKPWPWFLERSKNKKLNLFIYNINDLKKYGSIDTLIKRRIYKRLQYNESELDSLKWVIVVKK